MGALTHACAQIRLVMMIYMNDANLTISQCERMCHLHACIGRYLVPLLGQAAERLGKVLVSVETMWRG
jgi:hypothetical protein